MKKDKNNLRESDKCWRQAKKIQHTDNGVSEEENEAKARTRINAKN